MEIISYLSAAAAAGIVASIFALFQELEKRRKKKKEPTLQDRISNLTKNLKSSVAVITEIEEEISRRKNLAVKLEADIERYSRLKEINQAQVEAIAQALEIPIKKESLKSLIRNSVISILIAGAFLALGYFLGGR